MFSRKRWLVREYEITTDDVRVCAEHSTVGRVRVCANFFSRAKGLLGWSGSMSEPAGVLLAPCTSVHTFGMRLALDVYALDARGKVLAIREAMPPRRVFVAPRGTFAILELAPRSLPGISSGDMLGFVPWVPDESQRVESR